MSANTKIEWADHTFNPWIGCTKISPGCDNCYAKADFDDRRHRVVWGAGQPRSRTKTWGGPVTWNKNHAVFFAEHGRRQRVFCASLADVFDNEVDPAWRSDLFTLISSTPNLDWLLLTKRIGNVKHMLGLNSKHYRHEWGSGWPNVWLGISVVNQEEADRDIPKLLTTHAAKRFLSIEPMLGPISLTSKGNIPADDEGPHRIGYMVGPDDGKSGLSVTRAGALKDSGIDWVICGGESGPNARPMHPDWVRGLRDQCEAAGVPFLFKQWGEFLPVETDSADYEGQRVYALEGCGELPERRHQVMWAHGREFAPLGKKAAGRMFDDRTWDGFPA